MANQSTPTVAEIANDTEHRVARGRVGTYEREAVAAIIASISKRTAGVEKVEGDASVTGTSAWIVQNTILSREEEKLVQLGYECDDLARRLHAEAIDFAERMVFFADRFPEEHSARYLPDSPTDSSGAQRLSTMRMELKAAREKFEMLASLVLDEEVVKALGVTLSKTQALTTARTAKLVREKAVG